MRGRAARPKERNDNYIQGHYSTILRKKQPLRARNFIKQKMATRLRLPALALCPRACVCSASQKASAQSPAASPMPAHASPHRRLRILGSASSRAPLGALALRHRRRSPPGRSFLCRFAFGRPFSPLLLPRHVWRRREERNALIYIKEREKLFTFRKSAGFKKISPERYANKSVHRENCVL